jgi:pimeloyl-ACP methyl ester carboxylesterase
VVLERVGDEARDTLQRMRDTALHEPDPEVHGMHGRAVYSAWFANPEMAEYFHPPAAASLTGAAIAARLRREGYDWRERLRALPVPTLVIHGERDALPAAVALELCELLPRARHILLPDAGHMPFWEAPQRFFGAVEAFLAAPTTGPPR